MKSSSLSLIAFRFSLMAICCCFSNIVEGQIPPPIDPFADPTSINTNTIVAPTGEDLENMKDISKEEELVKNKIDEEKARLEKEEKDKEILALKRQNQLPPAKIWGQQFFRDQSIDLFTRSRDMQAIDSYIIGVGDQLIVTVWGRSDFSKNVSVDEDGYVDLTIPEVMIPRLYIKGMKFAAVRKIIYERLANHMNMSGSYHDIKLNYSRSLTVNITGEVFNPGSYTIPAVNTAFNALVASGGPSQIGSVRKIMVVSSDKPTRTLDVYKFATNPNVADEFFLSNNDYIYVPLAGRVVEVKGMVKRPFFYELIDGEELKNVIQYAGGLDADAYLKNIQIRRYIDDEEKIIDVNLGELLKSEEDFRLLNGDIVNISPISTAYTNYVTISGAVRLPGEYELKPGIHLNNILDKSGIMLSAVMDKIYVKRIQPDFSIKYIHVDIDSLMADTLSIANIELRALDDIEVKFKSDFVDGYEVKIYGQVRKPGQYLHSDSLSLADLLYLSNGIKKEAAKSIIEISRLEYNSDGSTYTSIKQFPIDDSLNVSGAGDFLMRPHDQVFVRLSKAFELPQNVSLSGEVMFPGTYTIVKKGERISDLIARAGGFTSIAFLEGASLQRPGAGFVVVNLKEVMQDSNSKFNYYLKEGDVLKIPKAKDLVAIAGRINHPHVKDQSEIDEIELKVELMKLQTELEKEQLMADRKIGIKRNPHRINVPYHKGKSARFYIKEYAGGVDKENGGRNRLIFVRYPDGSVKKTRHFLFFKCFPKVEKGAMVYVDTRTKDKEVQKAKPARRPIDWNRVLSDGFALLASAATVFGVITAIRRNP